MCVWARKAKFSPYRQLAQPVQDVPQREQLPSVGLGKGGSKGSELRVPRFRWRCVTWTAQVRYSLWKLDSREFWLRFSKSGSFSELLRTTENNGNILRRALRGWIAAPAKRYTAFPYWPLVQLPQHAAISGILSLSSPRPLSWRQQIELKAILNQKKSRGISLFSLGIAYEFSLLFLSLFFFFPWSQKYFYAGASGWRH